MSDFGVFGQNAIDRMQFFRKSEVVLSYISKISKWGSEKEKHILSEASDVITQMVHRLMNEGAEDFKDILKEILENQE